MQIPQVRQVSHLLLPQPANTALNTAATHAGNDVRHQARPQLSRALVERRIKRVHDVSADQVVSASFIMANDEPRRNATSTDW